MCSIKKVSDFKLSDAKTISYTTVHFKEYFVFCSAIAMARTSAGIGLWVLLILVAVNLSDQQQTSSTDSSNTNNPWMQMFNAWQQFMQQRFQFGGPWGFPGMRMGDWDDD
ncbi:hypothetical protein DPMN_157684 [Dreissena polymorpha]|uniref:Uncharacterized protein n=1 Tax=Dreissena polymorpha TaxID=45954 RepID=A0A9D4EJX3_DREPO|nr:hypothetical protein DPMN_157684 [Dreissena polymorpha]